MDEPVTALFEEYIETGLSYIQMSRQIAHIFREAV